MPIIELPDGREVEFPDGMSTADMSAAIQRNFPEFAPKKQAAQAPAAAPAPTPAKPARERTWGEALGDTASQLGEGVHNIAGAIPNLIAPESGVAKYFNDGSKAWRDAQSDPIKQRTAEADVKISAAGEEGVIAQVVEAARQYSDDPVLAARFVFTNLPSMIPGIGAAKIAQAAALARGASAVKAASIATTAAGATNAALNAGGARGEAFEDIKSTLVKQGMSPAEAEQKAIADSRLPAAIGAATGFISGKTGLEGAIAGAASRTAGGAVRRGAASAITELAGEQLEEVAPKLATNYQAGQYDGRAITQDVGRTMVETAIGSGPGAGVGAWAAARNPQAAADPASPNRVEPSLPPNPLALPAPVVAVDANGNAMTAEQRNAMRNAENAAKEGERLRQYQYGNDGSVEPFKPGDGSVVLDGYVSPSPIPRPASRPAPTIADIGNVTSVDDGIRVAFEIISTPSAARADLPTSADIDALEDSYANGTDALGLPDLPGVGRDDGPAAEVAAGLVEAPANDRIAGAGRQADSALPGPDDGNAVPAADNAADGQPALIEPLAQADARAKAAPSGEPSAAAPQPVNLVRMSNAKDFDWSRDKPNGTYASIADDPENFASPFADDYPSGQRHDMQYVPKSPLEVGALQVRHARFGRLGAGDASAGVKALHASLPQNEFDGALKMSKADVQAQIAARFPGVDSSKATDAYEAMEIWGAQEAKARGHDIIIARDSAMPAFSEAVLLAGTNPAPATKEGNADVSESPQVPEEGQAARGAQGAQQAAPGAAVEASGAAPAAQGNAAAPVSKLEAARQKHAKQDEAVRLAAENIAARKGGEINSIQREQAATARDKDEALDRARADTARKKDAERRDIDARMDASAENFQLGQSADDSLSGQEGLAFSVAGDTPIPAAFYSRVDVQVDVWDKAASSFKSTTMPADQALDSVRGDIDTYRRMIACMKG